MQKILSNTSLTFEFQTSCLKLLVYNYVIVLLIANQDVAWNYKFRDSDLANRLGHELIEPKVLEKFGFCYRFLTIVMNTLAVLPLLEAKRKNRNFLLPCILWNIYTLTAVAENICEIVWSMIELDVPFKDFATIFIVGLFMLAFQTKLTIQVIRFYEYLNYVENHKE
ncbi:uncharacterized protein LOC119613602 [Lucilia sericata]|uniref:uncharacterized protein LOC119613602 n=1 Tax=Lucilia sericata TaxID=13632 RepID=UPI0018A88049|nr:uncharacterized protein LOC119613602 [Lucilia sericata]